MKRLDLAHSLVMVAMALLPFTFRRTPLLVDAALTTNHVNTFRTMICSKDLFGKRRHDLGSRGSTMTIQSKKNLNDASTDDYTHNPTTRASIESLLGGVMGRATRTLSTKNNSDPDYVESRKDDASTEQVLGAAIERATRTVDTKNDDAIIDVELITKSTLAPKQVEFAPPESQQTPYLENPCITLTALAKSQWSHIIRPNIDTVIDATCGNGHDSVAISKLLLFEDAPETTKNKAQLICIDVQKDACDATRGKLSNILDVTKMEKHVQIQQRSHSPLLPEEQQTKVEVSLVCYNLGYLPNRSTNEDTSSLTVTTRMKSTISSICDAALLIRLGGMISVVTYPKTNPNEDYAVHAMLEGLALLSSKQTDWREYLAELGPDPVTDGDGEHYAVRSSVQSAMERISHEEQDKQAWRVMEHKQFGRPLSPIFLTAIRIK